jgi:hypothetical protein
MKQTLKLGVDLRAKSGGQQLRNEQESEAALPETFCEGVETVVAIYDFLSSSIACKYKGFKLASRYLSRCAIPTVPRGLSPTSTF